MITDDGRDVEPGSGETGRVAVGGFQPIGYYKDEAKSAATFIMFDGKRYSVPGDFATVEADGSHHAPRPRLGVHQHRRREGVPRGGRGGAQDRTPPCADAVAVGMPDEKFGEAITAVVELAPGADARRGRRSSRHVKGKLAAYKAPKRVLAIDTIGRAPNGKVDYKRLKQLGRRRARHHGLRAGFDGGRRQGASVRSPAVKRAIDILGSGIGLLVARFHGPDRPAHPPRRGLPGAVPPDPPGHHGRPFTLVKFRAIRTNEVST